MNLYKIGIEYESLMNEIDAYAAEHDGEIAEELLARLDNLSEIKDDTINDLVADYKNHDAMIKMLKAEIEDMKERIKYHEEKKKSRKSTANKFLKGINWEGTTGVGTYRQSTKLDDSGCDDLRKVPDEAIRVTVTHSLDKTKATQLIKAGVNVYGCKLVTNNNLTIK